MGTDADIAIVGAGHAGLAVAARCAERALDAVTIDGASGAGSSWQRRPEGLLLNTEARFSNVSKAHRVDAAGRWPTADEFAAYLGTLAEAITTPVLCGMTVERVERTPKGWLLATSTGTLSARVVVVATGPDAEPVLPRVAGLNRFQGWMAHSHEIRSWDDVGAGKVVVVGGGESGALAATALARRGDVDQVWMSFRTPPYIVLGTINGISAQRLAISTRYVPAFLRDVGQLVANRTTVPDLSSHGLPRPPFRQQQRMWELGRAAILDRGFVSMVQNGRIRLIGPTLEVEDRGVVVSASPGLHRQVHADSIVLATGFRPALGDLVGHLGVLGPDRRPAYDGVRRGVPPTDVPIFVGYRPIPTGNIREARFTARRVTAALQRAGTRR